MDLDIPDRWAFVADLWLHDGEAGWYFVTLPFDVADEIEMVGEPQGFGSVKVEVTVGGSTWRTSVFPDTKRKSYLLPVKKQVRTTEGLIEGEPVAVELRLVDLHAG